MKHQHRRAGPNVHVWSAVLLAFAGSASTLPAQQADSTTVHLGGFVDAYYAWDSGRPRTLDREYTTTAARHNEVNVNLAYLDATLSGPRLRGRLAVQYGTAVQANYAGEPRIGAFSGPDVSRFLQEATVGYRVQPSVWVDAGVFFAPFGAESWISRDNLTYTRSLIADYSPYYESGLRAIWTPSARVSAQLHVINGWQNISETNGDKAVGFRVDVQARRTVRISYDAFVGNEQPDSLPSRLRQFHEGILEWTPVSAWTVRLSADLGREARAATASARGASWWRGGALIARRAITSHVSLTGRGEFYSDPEKVMVTVPTAAGLRATGASLGIDVAPEPAVRWRTEWRVLAASDTVFMHHDGGRVRRNQVLVTSIALTF